MACLSDLEKTALNLVLLMNPHPPFPLKFSLLNGCQQSQPPNTREQRAAGAENPGAEEDELREEAQSHCFAGAITGDSG